MEYTNIFKVRQLSPIKLNFHDNNRLDKNTIFFKTNNLGKDIYTDFNNHFVGTYYNCYINHGNAVFSPSDLWLVICMSFSIYANENMELMKKYINPNFKEKKTLMVETYTNFDWEREINSMIQKIKDHSFDKDLIELLKNDFECSSNIEKTACEIATMETVSKFYKYKFTSYCGFNHIKLIGSLDTWNKLKSKIEKLNTYGNYNWQFYTTKLLKIVDKFIESFNTPDIKYFEKMISTSYESGLYGDTADTISGWILNLFYGFKDSYIVSEVPEIHSKVNAEIYDNGNEYDVTIKTGFSGTSVTCDPNQIIYDFRPVIYCQIIKC